MRKKCQSIDSVKEKIKSLAGKNINMQVCRGRKRISKYTGIIENAFPSVFVVRLDSTIKNAVVSCLSYSYNDVLCGEVQIDEVC